MKNGGASKCETKSSTGGRHTLVFVVRNVTGSPKRRTGGFAVHAKIRKISSLDVVPGGTHSRPAAAVPAAAISGTGPRAFAAQGGRCTKIGMKKSSAMRRGRTRLVASDWTYYDPCCPAIHLSDWSRLPPIGLCSHQTDGTNHRAYDSGRHQGSRPHHA
jgi:hypothetical protein